MHAVLLADPSEPRIARVDALGDEANYHWLCEMAQILRRARGARAQRQLNPSGPLTATRLQMDVIVRGDCAGGRQHDGDEEDTADWADGGWLEAGI